MQEAAMTVVVFFGLFGGMWVAFDLSAHAIKILTRRYRQLRAESDEHGYDVAYKLVRNTKSYRRQKEHRRKQGNDREFTVGAPKFETQGRK